VSELSARVEALSRSCLARDQYEEALREIHRAQCNCSYWHGVFGGFYLPHLREAVHRHALRADALADELRGMPPGWWLEEGEDEVRLKSPSVSVAVGRDAGAIVEIAARRRPFDFVGVIARRREAYHARVEEASRRAAPFDEAVSGAPETIHGAISVKEPGLERLLVYDERPRSASQEWIRSEAEVERAGGLGASIGGGPVGVTFALAPGSDRVRLRARDPRFEALEKEIAPGRDEREFEVSFRGVPAKTWLLTEWNLSLLTPDAPGRRLILEGLTPRTVAPGSTGRADGVTSVRLADDEYLRASLTLRFTPAARLEWGPVETVSLSEAGAERVYQGTAFLIGFRGPDVIRIHARVDEADNVL
jgi:alpha-amylase